MVTILAWLLLGLMVAVPVCLGLLALRRRRPVQPPPDRLTYAALTKLYAIRQRLNVSQYRSEVRREGAKARRTLRAELAQWEEWDSE